MTTENNKTEKEELEKLNELLNTQGSSGNWDYDPYMHGMYNGMELCLSILEGRDPVFKDAPDVWLSDSKEDMKPK
jgi:hypothetical protein